MFAVPISINSFLILSCTNLATLNVQLNQDLQFDGLFSTLSLLDLKMSFLKPRTSI